MSQEIFVQCIDCNRIYPATRGETGTVWTTTRTGCPRCGGTTVRDITKQGATDQSYAPLEGEPHDVETDALGEARFQVNEDGTEVDYEVTVENIRNVTQAHIHLGAEGEDGPVVVRLYPEEEMEPELIEGSFSGTLAEGTITEDDFVGEWEDVDFEEAIAIFEEGGAYVNVRTEEHPGGEIRGQTLPSHQ